MESDSEAKIAADQLSTEKSKSDIAQKSASQETFKSGLTKSDSTGSQGWQKSRSTSRSPDGRPISTGSGSELTRSGRRKKKGSAIEGAHKVTFTVTIAKAIPKSK